ncbi:unnamed protein product [Caenorhabditis angaria]|uniref:Replication stress response regulator SDE2 n=1 Tax=Caenorhabditis angaria TaxID=860376 RepID=A0A9P1IVK4_9PELO|nr:unnamed protein product [Caenorhabditis angaria]
MNQDNFNMENRGNEAVDFDFGMEADDEASEITFYDSQVQELACDEEMSQLDLSDLSIHDNEDINLGNMSDEESEKRTSSSTSTQGTNTPSFTATFPDKHYFWMNDEKTIKFIRENFSPASFYIMHNGKIVEDFEEFVENYKGQHLVRFTFHYRCRGGKGGFGSLLRSFRVNKSTNKLMMRDLNGRRLASVDEEGRLKRYLERQARKEEELRQKRKAKLERLTAGPPKHKFEDQEYLQKREEIIENTEDACEAGFAYLKELKKKEKKCKSGDEENEKEVESDGEDIDIDDLFNQRGGRKRKIEGPNMEDDDNETNKKMRNDESSDSEDDSDNEPDPEELAALRQYFENNQKDQEEEQGTSKQQEEIIEEEPEKQEEKAPEIPKIDEDIPKIDEKQPCEYAAVNLDDYVSAQDLELLGLEHLKSALTERGLKCGGSLCERAQRLWSIKGIEPAEWPTSILTPEMKKSLASACAEKNSKKKQKKSKK